MSRTSNHHQNLFDQMTEIFEFLDRQQEKSTENVWDVCESIREKMCGVMQSIIAYPMITSFAFNVQQKQLVPDDSDHAEIQACLSNT